MDDIDTALEQLAVRQQEFDAALAECEAEQAAGRIGMSAYRRAAVLYEELKGLTERIVAMIEAVQREIA